MGEDAQPFGAEIAVQRHQYVDAFAVDALCGRCVGQGRDVDEAVEGRHRPCADMIVCRACAEGEQFKAAFVVLFVKPGHQQAHRLFAEIAGDIADANLVAGRGRVGLERLRRIAALAIGARADLRVRRTFHDRLIGEGMDHQLARANLVMDRRDLLRIIRPVAGEHLQMQQAAAQQSAAGFQRQCLLQVGGGACVIKLFAPEQVATILQAFGEIGHQGDGLVETVQRLVDPAQAAQQQPAPVPSVGIACIHRQHRFIIGQCGGVAA